MFFLCFLSLSRGNLLRPVSRRPRVRALDRGEIRRMLSLSLIAPQTLIREKPPFSAAVLDHVDRADDVLGQELERGALPPHLGV